MAKKEKRKAAEHPGSTGRTNGPTRGLPVSGAVLRWAGIALVLWLVLAVLYPGPVFRGEVFRSGDTLNANSFAVVGDASLAAGHYPQWNPYLFAGMPSFGSLAYARYLYPPSVLLGFLQNHLGFPPLTWLLAHLLFGGLGMAWFLNRWRLPTGALILGALIWIMAPKVVAWSVHGHGTKLGAAMYLPWIVGWAWRVLDGQGLRAVGMTGLLLGMQLLRGHVQITYYTLLAVGWLAFFNALWPVDVVARAVAVRLRWIRVGWLAAGLVLGFLVGGLLLVPVHQYATISIRGQDTDGGGGVGLDYATGWSLAPAETGTLLLPASAGFGKATYLGAMPFNDYPNYLGPLLVLLAAAAWWSGAAGRRLTIALGVMSLLALLVSFGRHAPWFYELLYDWLPYFNKFRIPSMILILVFFAGAVLAPRGAAAWVEGKVPFGRPSVWPLVLAGLGFVLLVGGLTGAVRTPFLSALRELATGAGKQAAPVLLDEAWLLHRSSLIRIGLTLLAAGSGLYASLKNPALRGRRLLWILAALVAVDLHGVDRLIANPEQGLLDVGRTSSGQARLVPAAPLTGPSPAHVGAEPGPAAAQLAVAVGHERVWPLGAESGRNDWMTDGIRSLGGYHPAKLAQYEQIRRRLFSERPAGRLANWLSGSVVTIGRPLAEGDFAALRNLGADVDPEPLAVAALHLYRNRSALPRARLVTRWDPIASLPEKDALEPFLDGIQAGTIPVGDRVYLAETPDPIPQQATGPLPVPEFEHDGLDEVELRVNTPVPALLLLADMNAPGWRVEVDGRERPLLQADLVLRAVALEAGLHTVRFHYGDPTVRLGMVLSLVGTGLSLLLIFWPLIRRGDRPSPGEVSAHE